MNKKLILSFVGSFILTIGISQTKTSWEETAAHENALQRSETALPNKHLYNLNFNNLKNNLKQVTLQNRIGTKSTMMEFPDGEGNMKQYEVYEASVMNPQLAAKYPAIKSYKGIEVDGTSVIRFNVDKNDFHGMIMTPGKDVAFLDPVTVSNEKKYTLYHLEDMENKADFQCLTKESSVKTSYKENDRQLGNRLNDGRLRTLRLATPVTFEYTEAVTESANLGDGATEAQIKEAVMADIVTHTTRVAGIYETDLSVTFQLIANNDDLIVVNQGPETNFFVSVFEAGLGITRFINRIVGISSTDADLFTAFSTTVMDIDGAGFIEDAVCSENRYAYVAANTDNFEELMPTITFTLAHEVGHTFGATHTHNNFTCGQERNRITTVEPHYGNSIMGRGACRPGDELVDRSNATYFNAVTIQQILDNFEALDRRPTPCGVSRASGNETAPVANIRLRDMTIPASTPFLLTARRTGNDNVATYVFEQQDPEFAPFPLQSNTQQGPAFRSIPPSTKNYRFMPNLETILAGSTANEMEVVPSVSRTMNFRLTVRDNDPNGGRTAFANTRIRTVDTGEAFRVTSLNDSNLSLVANATQTITWNVAGTTGNGIDTERVNIFLIQNGDFDNRISLASGVPNDGSHDVVIPNAGGEQNRIMVQGRANVFFDISDADFTIEDNANLAYCVPQFIAADDSYVSIRAVVFGRNGEIQNFTNGNELYQYSDFTSDPVVDIQKVRTTPFTLFFNGELTDNQVAYVSIDYNEDGDFDDPSETLLVENEFDSESELVGTLNIPENVTNGVKRLRITTALRDANICNEAIEVEDYRINVVDLQEARRVATNGKENLTVYPVPSKDFITISSGKENIPFMIYSVGGQKVSSGIISNKKIDISNLSRGLYLIELFIDKEKVTRKIIKK
ncbi:zinc-dependent metalloprotease [Tenacibaculum amylolyticum]|uniref:zinc-dependent metalloprotease n=1 Tax=Tenacibaculum amylolyticum TaxID=104269 RepID=UPI0038948509